MVAFAILAAATMISSTLFTSLRSLGLQDRKSTRLNSSHSQISYAVFCLKKKKPVEADGSAGGTQIPLIQQHKRTCQQHRDVSIPMAVYAMTPHNQHPDGWVHA